MTLVIILAVAVALFGLAFLTKRRFGVLGLGLAAGVLLAQNASRFVSGFIEMNGVPVEPFNANTASIILLTLLPALLLLIAGPKYYVKRSALIGAIAFGVLGMLLILGPLTTGLPTDKDINQLLVLIARHQPGIIAVAILAAVFDTVFVHSGGGKEPKHRKH